MAKDRLRIEDNHYTYVIGWFLADEQEMGAYLGEGVGERMTPHKNPSNEHDVAENAALQSANVGRGNSKLFWDSKADAQAALARCKLAIKTWQSGKPWPEWAKTAVAAGWKAPKGWEP